MSVVTATSPPDLTPFEGVIDRLDMAVSAPVVVQRLLATLADPRSTVRDVEAVLAVDAALVMRLLKLASSAAYARRPVRDLGGAIRTVGLEQLMRLAVTAHFAQGKSPLSRELWSYALAVAFTCEKLAIASHLPPGPDPFLSGLLHDIGTLVLDRLFGERYARLGIVPGDERQVALEQQEFGFDHTDLGAMAVARWKLFPELELVVQLHHQPLVADLLGLPASARAVIELVALARLSLVVARDGLGHEAPEALSLRTELASRVGLTEVDAWACADEGRAKAVEVLGALGG